MSESPIFHQSYCSRTQQQQDNAYDIDQKGPHVLRAVVVTLPPAAVQRKWYQCRASPSITHEISRAGRIEVDVDELDESCRTRPSRARLNPSNQALTSSTSSNANQYVVASNAISQVRTQSQRFDVYSRTHLPGLSPTSAPVVRTYIVVYSYLQIALPWLWRQFFFCSSYGSSRR